MPVLQRRAENGITTPVSEPHDELLLTILMPCLNEVGTLPAVIRKAQGFLARSGIKGEVVIADNGSTDGSIKLATDLGARVVRVPVRGYGGALKGGIAAARGRFVIMGDADDSYDFQNLAHFVTALQNGADLVMGNRFRGGIEDGAMPPLHRYLGNPVLSTLGRIMFRAPVGDFHCGLRGFRRDAIQALGLRTEGMEFASEMVVQASLCGLDIREVPTVLAKDGRDRPPHLNTWRDGWRHLRFLLLHSPRWTFVYPGSALVALGGLIVAALLGGPVAIGAVTLDIRTFLVGCLAVLLGVQALTFGVIARRFASRNALLPSGGRLQRRLDRLQMEPLLRVAGLLGVGGLGGIVASTAIWGEHGFGDLDRGQAMRMMIVSSFAIVTAMQLGLSAVLMGVLDLSEPSDDARARFARLGRHFGSAA